MSMRSAWLAAGLLLAACAAPGGPRLDVGLGFGPDGVSVQPSVTTTVGDVTIGASPDGAAVGTTMGNVTVGASI